MIQSIASRLKPLLRWGVLGGTLVFLGKVLKDNWDGVVSIRVGAAGWACLAIALGVTLLAHVCAGYVWVHILQREFQQPVHRTQMIQAYLQVAIAKYLPGNIWHYYGRIAAATKAGASLETATVSVLLEPLLMAAAALLIALLSSQAIATRYGLPALALQGLILGSVLVAVHPKILNLGIQLVGKLKQTSQSKAAKSKAASSKTVHLHRYPLFPLLGELSFLVLRSGGFLLTFLSIGSFTYEQLPMLISAFSLAWLLGMVVPGAPGGLGVFETTAIALLNPQFSPGSLLGIVALYRLVSVFAETCGAGLSWLDQRLSS